MSSNLPTKVPTPTTTPASSSLLYIVDDPYGTPADDATTIANAVTKGHGLSDTTVLGVASGAIAAASTTGTGDVVRATSPALVTPTGIVKGDVGLGNVDNTADTAKPVSTAQQTALNLKANIASPTFTGTVTIPTGASITAPTGLVKGDVGLGSVDNTADSAKSVLSATKWTTARNLAGNSVDGSGNVAFANKFIVQGTTDTGLSGAQFLGALGTGIIKNTTTTGVLSIAVAADFPTLNQNTSGTAANLSGTPVLPNGTTATTQTAADNSTKLATTAYVDTGLGTKQASDSDLTTIAGLTATTDNFIQSKSSAWASRTPTQVTADLIAMVGDSGSGGTKGLVPAPATGDATKYLKGDGTWGTVSGGGSALTAKDEGVSLDTAVTSVDFVGAGVTATNTGHAVTVTVPDITNTTKGFAIAMAVAL